MNGEEFSDILSQISDQNKTTRKRGLEKILKLLEKDVEFSEDQRDEMMRVFERSERSFCSRVSSCDLGDEHREML